MKTLTYRAEISMIAAACIVGFSTIQGCGDDSATSTSESGAQSSSSSGTAGAGGVGGAGGGAGSGGSGGGEAGAGGSGGMSAIAPVVIPVSEQAHDRFFAVTHDPQGNIYATGIVADSAETTADFAMLVAKFSPSGELDTSFGEKGFATKNIAVGADGEVARGIVVQSTGKIVIAGTVEHAGATDARDLDIALTRFNIDGSLDTTFGTDGVVILDLSDGELVGTTYVSDTQWDLAMYSDDKLLITGAQKAPGRTDLDFAVVRLDPNGAVDATFGTNGVTLLDINQQGASPRTATILDDGSAVIAGYTRDADGIVSPVLFKLDSKGQLDASFGVGGVFNQIVLGAVTEAYAAALQGTSFVTAGYGRNSAAESLDWISLRIGATGTLDTTYGENGVTELDVAGFNDNARSLVTLPDHRLLLIGGGRNSSDDVDAMVGLLTENGQIDTSFESKGYQMFNLGGASDFFWGASVAPDGKSVAIVGAKGMAAGTGTDDSALLLMPTTL